MIGREVCAIHGGKTPRGIASPHLKHGRNSKHLPTRLLSSYLESLNDPQQLELTEAIAVIDSRIAELISKLDIKEARNWYRELNGLFSQLEQSRGDAVRMAYYINELGRTIREGASEYHRWGELVEMFETRRRQVETQRKMTQDNEQYIKVDRMMVMVSALLDVIRTEVGDRKVLDAISRRIDALIGTPDADD